MSFLTSWLGHGPAKPRIYDTDEIQPVHVLDDVAMYRNYDLFWTFPFKEILDADILGRSLSELIEMGDWRRLGGRFRTNAAGRLEIHIPTPFTPSRPPLYFTKEHIDQDMKDHPVASLLPVAGASAQLYPQSRELVPLAYGPGAPKSMEDRLAGDFPQLALHVVTFRDGTLVSLTWSHTMSDLGGFAAIVKAWVAHLHGQPVPAFKSTEDALRPIYEDPPSDTPIVIQKLLLTGWRKACWIAQFLLDQWWTTTDFTMHQLCIPKGHMDRLVAKSREEAASTAKETGRDGFISEGDVIVALGLRAAAMSLAKGTNRSVLGLGAVDARGRFPEVFDQNAAYVQNMSLGVCVMRPAKEVIDMNIGALALSIRDSMHAQLTQPQMRVTAALLYDSAKATRALPVTGDATAFLSASSNWSKANLLDIMDLGPAVVSEARETRTKTAKKKALPISFHSKSNKKGNFSTSVTVIRGRDHNGDMWLEGEMGPAGWEDMLGCINTA